MTLRISFASALIASLLFMKVISLLTTERSKRKEILMFLFSPLPSHRTWERCPPPSQGRLGRLFLNLLINFSLLILSYFIYWKIIPNSPSPKIFAPYLAIFPVLLLGETAGRFFQIVFFLLGKQIPIVHKSPLQMSTVSDFWSNRWNMWVSDWFRDIIFTPLRTRPIFAAFCVYIFSGILHEIIMNLPLFYIFGTSVLGTMLAYFLIQWIGVIIDRQFLKNALSRRAFAWITVVGPCPLFMNESTLRIVGLWLG